MQWRDQDEDTRQWRFPTILNDWWESTVWAAAAAKSLQSCPTLCDPIDGSPPGSPVPGILQARTLKWVAISFSNAWKWKVKVKLLSRVQLLATPWTAAYQAPLSMGFCRQEYWSGVPLPSLFFFWDPYNSNVGAFDVVPEVSETILTSFHSFNTIRYSGACTVFSIAQAGLKHRHTVNSRILWQSSG